MTERASLFELPARYVLDTNVVVAFLLESDDEPYGRDIMPREWDLFEQLIGSGEIVAPRRVEFELHGWDKRIPDMKQWVGAHRHMFRDLTDEQLARAKQIVNAYPDYGSNTNYLGDLEVLSLAWVLNVPVITLERIRPSVTRHQPKIPEVCREFQLGCLSVSGFLRIELKNTNLGRAAG
jgi:hypothetical protein